MNKKRPVNLDLTKFAFPLPAITSILHRVSGILLFIGVAIWLYILSQALGSAAGFDEAKACLSSDCGKIIILLSLAALIFHVVAGIKHLIMDMGIGESLEGARIGAWLVLIISAVLTALVGVWLW